MGLADLHKRPTSVSSMRRFRPSLWPKPLAEFRAAQTADKSKAAGRAATSLYEETCASQNLSPWPPTLESMELFAAFLRASTKAGPDAYKAPVGYWWAILQEARDRGHYVSFDPRWADRVVAGLERGMPEHEQALPLTVPLLCWIGAAVATEKDMVLLLSLVAAIFCVARADCFLHVRPSDIVDIGPDRVQVVLHCLKWTKRVRTNALVFRRLRRSRLGPTSAPSARQVVTSCCAWCTCSNCYARKRWTRGRSSSPSAVGTPPCCAAWPSSLSAPTFRCVRRAAHGIFTLSTRPGWARFVIC